MGQRFYSERYAEAWKRRHWNNAGRFCGCFICWKRTGFGRGPYDRAKQKKERTA